MGPSGPWKPRCCPKLDNDGGCRDSYISDQVCAHNQEAVNVTVTTKAPKIIQSADSNPPTSEEQANTQKRVPAKSLKKGAKVKRQDKIDSSNVR